MRLHAWDMHAPPFAQGLAHELLSLLVPDPRNLDPMTSATWKYEDEGNEEDEDLTGQRFLYNIDEVIDHVHGAFEKYNQVLPSMALTKMLIATNETQGRHGMDLGNSIVFMEKWPGLPEHDVQRGEQDLKKSKRNIRWPELWVTSRTSAKRDLLTTETDTLRTAVPNIRTKIYKLVGGLNHTSKSWPQGLSKNDSMTKKKDFFDRLVKFQLKLWLQIAEPLEYHRRDGDGDSLLKQSDRMRGYRIDLVYDFRSQVQMSFSMHTHKSSTDSGRDSVDSYGVRSDAHESRRKLNQVLFYRNEKYGVFSKFINFAEVILLIVFEALLVRRWIHLVKTSVRKKRSLAHEQSQVAQPLSFEFVTIKSNHLEDKSLEDFVGIERSVIGDMGHTEESSHLNNVNVCQSDKKSLYGLPVAQLVHLTIWIWSTLVLLTFQHIAARFIIMGTSTDDYGSQCWLAIAVAYQCIALVFEAAISRRAARSWLWPVLETAIPRVATVLVSVAPIILGYVMAGTIAFSSESTRFENFLATANTLFAVANGDEIRLTFLALEQTNDTALYLLGQIYLYSFIVFFTYVVLMVCIAIIEEAYFHTTDVLSLMQLFGIYRQRRDQHLKSDMDTNTDNASKQS